MVSTNPRPETYIVRTDLRPQPNKCHASPSLMAIYHDPPYNETSIKSRIVISDKPVSNSPPHPKTTLGRRFTHRLNPQFHWILTKIWLTILHAWQFTSGHVSERCKAHLTRMLHPHRFWGPNHTVSRDKLSYAAIPIAFAVKSLQNGREDCILQYSG